MDETVNIYREAVDYLIVVVNDNWSDIKRLGDMLSRKSFVEKLILKTKSNIPVYKDFEKRFYKFPCYLRRSAIADAIGKVSSYKSNLANWSEETGKRKPSIPKAGRSFPVLYRGNCFREIDGDKYACEIKAFVRNTWDWITVELRKSDVDYIEHHCSSRTKKAPSLVKHGKCWSLSFPFEEKRDLVTEVKTILSVDLGINNACTCCAMSPDGTILGRRFLKLSREQDSLEHAINRIKKAQQSGSRRMPRLWAKAKGINDDIASKAAQFIIDTATYYNADCIVFEFLDLNKKRRGSKKQALHMWKARAVQSIVTDKAHRLGMHISHVCAWGTSRLAFDGSGRVVRGIDGNYSICRFTSGKIYNCDLSASYNIGARYFIREIIKSLPEKVGLALEAKVPQVARRSTCTYSTLISLVAELKELAPSADNKGCTLATA